MWAPMPRETGHAILKKYFHVKAELQANIDDFAAREFGNNYVIGIHYRGTDKAGSGIGALKDCLLLGKSDLMIRTSSNLSFFAKYLNPKMPVIEVSQRRDDATIAVRIEELRKLQKEQDEINKKMS